MPEPIQTKKIKTELLQRQLVLKRDEIDVDNRLVPLSFSSETVVDRWFGGEILDHTPTSIRLGRLQEGGALLVEHDRSDHVGVIESVEIGADRIGRAMVRFGKSARAEEIFQDVIDGVRKWVSTTYRVHSMVLESKSDDGETYRVMDWEPVEISIVSIPADPSVGVARDAPKEYDTEIRGMPDVPEPKPENKPKSKPADAGFSLSGDRQMPEEIKPNEVDVEQIKKTARIDEQKRVSGIHALADKYSMQDEARNFVEQGRSLEEFRTAVLDKIDIAKPAPATADIGMSESESRQFSFIKAINALANPTDRRAQESAAFEFDASRAAADKMKKEPQGILVPADVLKRDLVVGTPTAGGNLVAENLLAANFIDLLRNRSALMGQNMATMLTGLIGDVAIPKQTGGATGYWLAESGTPTESQQTIGQVPLTPKTVGAYTDISRKLLQQSSIDVEAFVRGDLATVLGLAIDLAGIAGTGANNQPRGILNTVGIGSVIGGTNGAAPTWANIVALESEVAAANADVGRLHYLTNALVRGVLKTTEKASGTAQFVWNSNDVNGYTPIVSNQVPSDLTKGSAEDICSAIIFGNFADLLIGMWGGLDLLADPYTASTSGTVRVVALQDADIAVRHAESFAAMQDALTA